MLSIAQIQERIRQVYDYTWSLDNNLSGFPNFHQAKTGDSTVCGTIILKNHFTWRDVLTSDLGNPNVDDIAQRFRATNDYAFRNGYVGGFPNFHQADYGNGTVFGTILLDSNLAEWRDIFASDLGNPDINDIEQRFRATNDYAFRNGFEGGFPNFHVANHGDGIVYGSILIKKNFAKWQDTLLAVLNIFSNFSFTSAITVQQRQKLLQRHAFALNQISTCGNLNSSEQQKLFTAYRKNIIHDSTNDAGVNAKARLGGNSIWVNFGVLFPQGDTEISQTLIHEMMHIAGENHPTRRDSGPVIDTPYDNGQYYGSSPLRAEMCIAGFQSDEQINQNVSNHSSLQRLTIFLNENSCKVENGICIHHTN